MLSGPVGQGAVEAPEVFGGRNIGVDKETVHVEALNDAPVMQDRAYVLAAVSTWESETQAAQIPAAQSATIVKHDKASVLEAVAEVLEEVITEVHVEVEAADESTCVESSSVVSGLEDLQSSIGDPEQAAVAAFVASGLARASRGTPVG